MSSAVLVTERLTIRPAAVGDADAAYDLRTLPSVSRWIPLSDVVPRAEFRDMYAQRLAWLWVVEQGGAMIGEVILRVCSATAQVDVREQALDTQAEIGWVIHPDHQRRGYAREAVERMVEHAFAERGLRRLFAEAYAGNEATAALAPALGMRLEARHVQAALHRDLGWVDTVTYALLAEEWRASRDQAERS